MPNLIDQEPTYPIERLNEDKDVLAIIVDLIVDPAPKQTDTFDFSGLELSASGHS